jgi:glycosyltransferase involved in cell wall biosynthesis
MSESEHLLSICIPAYRSPAALFALLDSLLACARSDFEVVVSDDCSADDYSWGRLAALEARDARLRCARNDVNLGMDRNFARSVELARGRYVWLCGQDDMILTEGLDKVLDFLATRPEIDFIFFSHAQRIEDNDGDRLVPGSEHEAHVFGQGLASYLAHTRYHLPTFLPTYLIRTDLWRSVDVSRYYGTHYCQVGVFLEASRELNWCHFAGSHVEGRLPRAGWQSNPGAYTRIAFGHFAMLRRASGQAPWLDHDTIGAFLRLQRRRLVYACILWRHHRLDIAPELFSEMLQVIAPYPDVSRPVTLIRRLPRFASTLLYYLVSVKRLLRSRLARA